MNAMLTRFAAAAPLALLTAACAMTPAPDTQARNVPAADSYLALGTDTAWALEITRAKLNFIDAANARPLIVTNPGGRPSFNGMRYVTDALTVDVTRSACDDAISKRRYADTVTVDAAGKQYRGCGGRVLPPADLNGTSWRIAEIAGAPTIKDAPADIAFASGKISGNAGCNRMSGAYTADGSRLAAGPIMTTKMACAPDRLAQESAILALLSKPMSIRHLDDGSMLLMAPGGVTLRLVAAR